MHGGAYGCWCTSQTIAHKPTNLSAFNIRLQLVDQFGIDITHSSVLVGRHHGDSAGSAAAEPYRVSLSLNGTNEQGAVLWGISSNTTAVTPRDRDREYDNGGVIEINNLVISQPGPLVFSLSTHVSTENAARLRVRGLGHAPPPLSVDSTREKITLGVFHAGVKADPAQADTVFCMFVFKRAMCPAAELRGEAEREGDFPMSRHWLPLRYYMHVLVCEELFQDWFVTTQITPSAYGAGTAVSFSGEGGRNGGGVWLEHRIGVAALWVGGVGGRFDPDLALPRVEQSFYERLGLPEPSPTSPPTSGDGNSDTAGKSNSNSQSKSKSKSKLVTKRDIKRAYYKKSIIWHPDKWVNVRSARAAAKGRDAAASTTAPPSPYAMQVQSVFELVGEAYRELNSAYED